MKTIATIGNILATRHLYAVQVSNSEYVDVHANSRSQAASIAKRAGYAVWSVNMIG